MYIWRDKWLPTATTYAIQSPRKVFSEDAKVCNLTDSDSKWWNGLFLNSIFCKKEAEVISRIPLSKYGHKGVMIWKEFNTGDFIVRSAYHMEKDCQMAPQGECSHDSVFNQNSTKMFV